MGYFSTHIDIYFITQGSNSVFFKKLNINIFVKIVKTLRFFTKLTPVARGADSRGAELLVGGARTPDCAGNFFQPTLLAGVPNEAVAMQEESFGPILPVLAVSGDEEALTYMRDTRFGLTASIWTSDQERAEHFARSLDAGTIFQNRCDFLDPALPWTGYGDSGKGSTLSSYGYLHLTRRKSIHFRTKT